MTPSQKKANFLYERGIHSTLTVHDVVAAWLVVAIVLASYALTS